MFRLTLYLAKFFLIITQNERLRVFILRRIFPILARQGSSLFFSLSRWRRAKLVQMFGILGIRAIEICYSDEFAPAVQSHLKRLILDYLKSAAVQLKRKKQGWAILNWVIGITNRCNQFCSICYSDSGPDKGDLPLWVIEKIIEEQRDNGVHLVTLSGGEPFLRWNDIRYLAEKYSEMIFMIYTNGTLLSSEVIQEIARLGNITPCISLEGFADETDGRRGQGHFQAMLEVFTKLKKAGVVFGASVTARRFNAEVISSERFVDLCIEVGCQFAWIFHYIPIGRGADVSLMLTPSQRTALADAVNLWRYLQKPLGVIDFWNDGWLPRGCSGCLAGGRKYAYISPEGDICPCVFVPISAPGMNVIDIFGGKSQYASLSDAVNDSALFNNFRIMQSDINMQHDPTRPCPLIDRPEMLRSLLDQTEWSPCPHAPANFLPLVAKELPDVALNWQQRDPREVYLRHGPFE